MAVEKFSAVPNRSLPPVPQFDSNPFGNENQGARVFAIACDGIELTYTVDCGLFKDNHGLQGH